MQKLKVSQISAAQWGHSWWRYTLSPSRYPQCQVLCVKNMKNLVYRMSLRLSAIVTDVLPHVPLLTPPEAHWSTLSSHHWDPFMAVHSVLVNYISHNSTFVHARWCQEPCVWHAFKSKSSSPFGLRLPDRSHHWSHAVKYEHEHLPYTVPRALMEPIARRDKCT